jgi:hypothetical protein
MIWCGTGRRLLLVSASTGEVQKEVSVSNVDLIAVGYDPVLDQVWEADGDYSSTTCWTYDSNVCGAVGGTTDVGLTHDGVDMWHFAVEWMPPPAPNSTGFILPTFPNGIIDYSRLIDPPGIQYRDLAYDCMTFPVSVVWVASNESCEVIAYEVSSRAPCVPPGDRLLRTWIHWGDPLSRWLPPSLSTASRIWPVGSSFAIRDDLLFDETLGPLFYRLVGPGGAPRGNVLRAVKDAANGMVVLSN